MKAITLWQPWASLVACGAKKYETRSWKTDYRGPLVIHAAKRAYEVDREIIGYLKENGITLFYRLPLGTALCTVDLVGIIRTEKVRGLIGEQELACGNFQPGRFAWALDNIKVFSEPIPMKGRQGLWTLTEQEAADLGFLHVNIQGRLF